MATNPSALPENAGRITAADANYPYGSAKNDTTGTTGDGTPIRAPWMNDIYGFFQALLVESGQTPSGNAETALVSQLADAVKIIGGGEHGLEVFSTAGVFVWNVPDFMQSGAVKPKVRLKGGGGGGSRRSGIEGASSGGGGGGGGTSEKIIDLTGVASVTITIGSGGAGAAANNTAGTNGGATSFGAYFSATGGLGGAAGSGAGAGGVGVGGDVNGSLGPGGVGIEYTVFGGSSSVRVTGFGGGPGGFGLTASFGAGSVLGNNGIAPGGGGSGSAGTSTPGAGMPGECVIEW